MTEFKQLDEFVYEVLMEGKMRVPGRVYADEEIISVLKEEEQTKWSSLTQLKNVASLPGIQKYALALSDVHPGYGAPIGGVGAFGMQEGVITFALCGFDLNCGVRTILTPLTFDDIKDKKIPLVDKIYHDVPAGIGSTGDLVLTEDEIDEVLVKGAGYVVERGYGSKEDLEFTEENGKVDGADPEAVSHKAKKRQFKQVGTLGSGNHYIELQRVDEIYDEEAAEAYGLQKDQIVISLHCGSRALGHQIGSDYLEYLEKASKKYGIEILDKELVCAPIQSEEGQKYLSAVNAGINCAFANRQVLTHLARKAVQKVFPHISDEEMRVLYDVGHNTCKTETHKIDGKSKKLLVHRKGSTRAFGPGIEGIPEQYMKVGQPVLVGGTMGTCSYILKGTQKGMDETFGSAIHGAGRKMSRVKASKQWRGAEVVHSLEDRGIIVRSHSMKGVAEEAPGAYKDVNKVIDITHKSGIARKVAKVLPVVVVKG